MGAARLQPIPLKTSFGIGRLAVLNPKLNLVYRDLQRSNAVSAVAPSDMATLVTRQTIMCVFVQASSPASALERMPKRMKDLAFVLDTGAVDRGIQSL